MSRLEEALAALARFLDHHQVPYMVIGGLANIVWGIPRTTLDVDLTIWIAEDQMEPLITLLVQAFPARTGDPVAFAKETRVLPLVTRDGVQIDVIIGQLPFEQEAIQRAALQPIQGTAVRVCQPEDLVIYKLVSERLRDLEDVRGIIQQQAAKLDRRYLDPKVAS
ncbi:MAG: nucleotidyltransferase, partial [Candidatus Omnitrophica bacterium]|nr:nucleotidyltransferase [Candidatus Omnitrophota bacterium]